MQLKVPDVIRRCLLDSLLAEELIELIDVIGIRVDGGGSQIANRHVIGQAPGNRSTSSLKRSHAKGPLMRAKRDDDPRPPLELSMFETLKSASPYNPNNQYELLFGAQIRWNEGPPSLTRGSDNT